MPRSSRDAEFSAFVQTRRTELVRSACLLTAGDSQLAEDLCCCVDTDSTHTRSSSRRL
jgi:hypothetical protein